MDGKNLGMKTSSENNHYKLLKDAVMKVQDFKKQNPPIKKKS